MEDNENKEDSVTKEDGVTVDLVDVHMFDLGLMDVIDKFMSSNFIRGIGAMVILGIALLFGGMFLYGGVHLVKSTKSDAVVVESIESGESEEEASVSDDEAASEESEETTEEE